jgi:hypothetical protein
VIQLVWLFVAILNWRTYIILIGTALIGTAMLLIGVVGRDYRRLTVALHRTTAAELPHEHPGSDIFRLSHLGDLARSSAPIREPHCVWPC